MKKLLLISLLLALILILSAEQYTVNDNQNEVRLLSSSSQQSVIDMTLGHFDRDAVRINNEVYWSLKLKKSGLTLEKGLPELPFISRSLIIPNTAKMAVSILESNYTDVVMPIAPSKGNLTRDINPADVPYMFDSFYGGNGSYPASISRLSEPFIMRDYRGITVHFQPFVYYPSTRTLRIYTHIKLAVNNTGLDNNNVFSSSRSSQSPWFSNIYEGMFLNYNQAKYPVLDEHGRILVITHSMFNANIQPYVDWKRQKGYRVDVVDVATAGPTANQIKTYIQNQYNLNDDLAFVQLVGDAAQIPTLSSGGGGSDPTYALLAGTDSYPEIFIGRFSGTTGADIDTQVLRTVYYERDMQAGNPWLAKGIGVASNQGGGGQGDMGESDQVHIEGIRTQLLANGYTAVAQVYEAQGATQAQISTAINQGTSYGNYCGHGSDTSWGTTGYSNTQVNQLTNDNKLPHIVSVACVNGNFTNMTCFAEAWLRAKNPTTQAPTGAIVFYGSSINQSWNPPMLAEDEIADLLTGNQKNTIGGLYFNGSSRMMESYGADGQNMYKTWHIFGDASLQVRSADPTPLTATFSPLMIGMNTLTVQTAPNAWVALSANGTSYGSAVANATGTAVVTLTTLPTGPMDISITITGYNKVTYLGTVGVLPNSGPYVTVTNVAVNDANDQADSGETCTVDLTLSNVGSDPANAVTATITSYDEYLNFTDDTYTYGNIPAGGNVASTSGFVGVVANNVPDQHVAAFHVAIATGGTVTWEYDMDITLNAPAFTAGAIQIDDATGNNNGRVEAGELFTLTIPVTNSGHTNAADVAFSLMITNALSYIITPIADTFPEIAVGETADVVYNVAFSSQVPAGSLAQFMLLGASGQYGLSQTFNMYVGMVMEDFESSSFTAFPWTFTGGNWTIDAVNHHGGANSAKSATIGANGSTQMLVTMNVPAVGNITFWKKVSSEQSYDYLKFYINGVLKNQWSGTIDWSQETYPVTPGNAVFKWEYMKDNMVDSGSDCAWVDDIVFPSTGGNTGTPVYACSVTELNFGTYQPANFSPITLTLTNSGTVSMIGTLTGTPELMVRPAAGGDYLQNLNYLIPAGGSLALEALIFPTAPGNFSADLTVSSDDPDHLVTVIPVTAIVLTTANDDQITPAITALKGNYPNPFNPTTTIHYSLKTDSPVQIEIYNLLGQKVKTLVNGAKKSGNHSIVWNGKDDAGRNAGSGIYFYKMTAGKYSASHKMVLMK